MKRRRRTEILIKGNHNLVEKFANEIVARYTCHEVLPPTYGLTMMKMRETAKNSLFYLGEVLITEAKVEINQQIGTGIVIGMEEELAKDLAIVDAAYQARLPETKQWEELLMQEEKAIYAAKLQKQAEILNTKVQFETLDIP